MRGAAQWCGNAPAGTPPRLCRWLCRWRAPTAGHPCPPSAGLLSSLTSTFTDLGLDVVRAEIGGKGGNFHDTFWVTTADGRKVGAVAAGQACCEAHLSERPCDPA